jgi:hypothetical protein
MSDDPEPYSLAWHENRLAAIPRWRLLARWQEAQLLAMPRRGGRTPVPARQAQHQAGVHLQVRGRMSSDKLKAQAKALRAYLAEQGITITHSRAQEAIARCHGMKNWNTALAHFRGMEAA